MRALPDDLEPLRGTYDWDLAFAQNPDEPVYEVSDEMRRRVHHLPHAARPAIRPVMGFRQVIRAVSQQAAAVTTCLVIAVTGIMPHVIQTAQGTSIEQHHRRRAAHKPPNVTILVHRAQYAEAA